MPRLNVFIPDELNERLETHRGHMNLSAICQDALDKELTRLEAARAAAGQLDEAVLTRLREEKARFEQYWYDVGVQLGKEWATSASYVQLRSYGRDESPPSDVVDMIIGDIPPNAYPDAVWDLGLPTQFPALQRIYSPPTDEGVGVADYDRQALSSGWHAAVKQIWAELNRLL